MAPLDPLAPARRGEGRAEGRAPAARHRPALKPGLGWGLLIVVGMAAALLLARQAGLGELLSVDGLERLRRAVEAWGTVAPLVFVAGYAVAELFFVPALPLTLLGGLVFGPLWGTVYVSAGATLGAALAFGVARHALRGTIERWIAGSPRLSRLDEAVAAHGWRILVVTRLVPLFPFNLQNFAYGLTRIRFATFVGLSWLCMLPGTAAYTLAAGALGEGGRDPRRTAAYLAAAGILLVAVSLLPRWIGRRAPAARAALDGERS